VLEQSFRDPAIRLHQVARAVGVTPQHLAHLLKAATGRTFLAHVHDLRLRAAEQLLRATLKSVKEIAVTVGYVSTTSFDRQFRRRYGCTPTQWRQRHAYEVADILGHHGHTGII
jgi:AraC-like DNA-binding protein